jgi:hypothetical protein
MLAEQFSLAGGGQFKQPLLPGDDGYPGPKMVLTYRRGMCDTYKTVMPYLYAGAIDTATSTISIANDGPYNNTGIPGIRCIDYLFPGYGSVNPYAKRFFSQLSARPIDEVTRINPTFFTCWVGANDVLGYAANGGTEAPQDQIGTTRISNEQMFHAAYDSIVTHLTKKGAKGVVINIPDITSIPYFNTVPPNGLTLTIRQANDLNNAYNSTGIRFAEGSNYFVIQTPQGIRQIKPSEYVLLNVPQDSIKCAGWGSLKPIPGRYILTKEEIDSVQTAVMAFNTIITMVANEHNVPIVDMNQYMKTLQSGIAFNGQHYNATFVSGGAFSLDGIHLTPRGYALVANRILETVNYHYKATIPMVNLNQYPGVKFPDKN